MRELTTLIIALLALYLLLAIFVYLIQRSLIYYPVPSDLGFAAQEITLDNNGTRLHGWVLNPDKDKAMVYFGGNAEQVTGNQGIFQDLFRDYSVYLVNYRGYGDSEGRPSEAALFADALAIYDHASRITTRYPPSGAVSAPASRSTWRLSDRSSGSSCWRRTTASPRWRRGLTRSSPSGGCSRIASIRFRARPWCAYRY